VILNVTVLKNLGILVNSATNVKLVVAEPTMADVNPVSSLKSIALQAIQHLVLIRSVQKITG
jgi:hypothetical protein